MEEIIQKANELGLMIKGTDLYKRYVEVSEKLEKDEEGRKLLEEYIGVSETLYQKERSGGVIEVEEKQRLQEMNEKVSQNQLIKEFMATQTYFMNLMMQIQKTINEPKGDPIEQSKIIKPGGAGKIITGI